MDCLSLLSFAACVPDPGLRAVLPFAASEINREAIPPLIRRRTSQATQLAFSAAEQACRLAGRSPSALSAIFASLGAEIQTTDQICLEIANPEGVVSPNAFHNSVQNAAVGYWSIVQQCTQAASALSAGEDTFAMGLLEAWCQLACQGGELLLVCYDEVWPPYLAPGRGKAACACALVLAAGAAEGALMHIDRPELGAEILPTGWHALPGQMPPLSAIPLLSMASGGMAQTVPLSIRNPGWQVRATPCRV